MLLSNIGVLGIDIGSNSIKVVELQEIGTSYQLKSVGESPLARGSVIDKAIVNAEVVSDTLLKLLEDLSVEADDAAVSISGEPVLLKRVSLPRMSDAELKKSIKWELEKLNANASGEFSYDYEVISNARARDMIDVIIVAANKQVTKEYLSVVTNVGLNPAMIDLDVFSLQSVYEVNYPESSGVIALVNVGASITNILIMDNGQPVYARDLKAGGDIYTKLIMEDMGLSFEEAEEVKHSQRVGITEPGLDILTGNFTELISNEIKQKLDHFSLAHSYEKVTRIMISGGSSTLPGFKDRLSDETESYVGILNPFRNINYRKDAFDPEYIEDISPKMNIATGLALRVT